MKHLLSMNHLSTEEIMDILQEAERFSKGESWTPNEKIFAVNLFFEPSTRTKSSFEIAERKLGLDVIPFERDASSLLKGESLYDTVKTFEALGVKVAVIRHQQDHFYQEWLDQLQIPLINGGDGCGQHPTQSLLDLFTIQQTFQTFHGLKIAMIGDIIHSRVAKSNMQALKKLGAEVIFSGPPEWFDDAYLTSGAYRPLDEAIKTADVLMLLRIQHERHESTSFLSDEEYHQRYGLTVAREKMMKSNSIIMHPAPVNRNVEIADELVECRRSRIFKQMENGVYVRMAVLKRAIESLGGVK